MSRADLRRLMGPTTAAYVERSAGSLLKMARARTGLTQVQVAERSGVPQSTISKIERGRLQPSMPLLSQVLAGAGLEMRIQLAPFDDHDLVLDRRAAADPAAHAAAERAADEWVATAGPREA